MNTQDLIELYIQQYLNNNQQQNSLNKLDGLRSKLNTVDKWGNYLQNSGNYLQSFDNNVLNKLGSGLSKSGNYLQNGVSTITNAPKNVFTGFAQPTNPAIESAISNSIGNTVGATAETGGAFAGGPMGALVALGTMALQGTNRKRAKQGAERLLNQTNQMANMVENDNSTQDFANQMVKQAQNNIAGNMTGGASPIEPDVVGLDNEMSQLGYTPQQKMLALNGLNGGDRDIANLVDKYNIQKPQVDVPVETPVDTPNVQTGSVKETKRGLLSKFMSGLGDFAQGYQENRYNGFKPENFDQNRFAEETTTYAPNQQLIDYQNSLRNNDDFIKWANNAQKDKETVINNIANGQNGGYSPIDEWIKANPEALKPVANTQTTYTGKEKGKMARFGEGVGTIARALQNPNFQGIVAGGVGTALTGNPLYGLGLGYKFANQRAMSDAYRNILKQYGVNVPEMGTFGNITGQDMGTIGKLAENHVWHQYLNQRYMDELARKIAHDEVLREHYANQDKARQQQANASTTSANARVLSAQASKIRADKAGQGKGGSGKGGKGGTNTKPIKPQDRPNWGRDLAEYSSLMNNPKYAMRMPQIKARFIKEYGVDPDKFIKD